MKKFLASTISSAALLVSVLSGSAAAAGTASLSMSPASGSYTTGSNITVTITENSGADSVNVVQADLSYDASKLQFVSSACNGAFEIAASANANGITCGTTTAKTGAQTVGSVTFRALASGSVTFAGSSAIYRSTDNSNVWNGAANGANFTVTAPVSTPTTPAPTTGTGSTGTGNTGTGNNTGTGSGSTTNPADPTTPAPTTGTVEGTSTKVYTVTIKVVDNRGDEVKGAKVTFNGKTITTDRSGKAIFSSVKAGTYDAKAVSGNLNVSGKLTVNAKNKTTQNFMLQLPRAKRNGFGFLLGTAAVIAIIGGGLMFGRMRSGITTVVAAKKAPKALAAKKKSVKPLRLASAKR